MNNIRWFLLDLFDEVIENWPIVLMALICALLVGTALALATSLGPAPAAPPPPEGTPETVCRTEYMWLYNPSLKMTEPYPYTVCDTEYHK